jgi:hypothetical protein
MTRALLLLVLLGACSARPPAPAVTTLQPQGVLPDQHVPDYAKRPFEPFSRVNAIAIAQREWRAFGSPVNDAPPGRDEPVEYRADRQPGLWQRVGDYWWFGQNAASKESGWTGRYNEFGTPYGNEPPAWSAAFVSYVMRAAGAGDRFPYSALHADYINAAAQGQGVLQAQRPDAYAPLPGDLICYGRAGAQRLRFEDLPAPRFFGHCDIVVEAGAGLLTVIGGNVSAGVTMKHVPVMPNGTLAGPDGQVIDGRYPWFVVLQVRYDG